MGRPSTYTDAMASDICERIACGDSLRTICADAAFPVIRTVLRWLASGDHPEFVTKLARAREAQADVLALEIMEISDTPLAGKKTIVKPNGIETTTADMIEHRRLQVDTRKWLMARMAPKKYGAKTTQDITLTVDEMTPEQRALRAAAILAKVKA